MKLLGIGPHGFPGASRVLRDLAGLGLADFTYLEDLRFPVDTDLCILAAWAPAYHLILDKLPCTFVLWTSPLTQAELSDPELDYLSFIMRSDKVERVWCERSLAEVLGGKAFWLPFPVDVERVQKYKQSGERSGVGLFVPSRGYKNIASQLAAVKLLQNRDPSLLLHTNVMDTKYRRLISMLNIQAEFYPWLPEEEYYRLLGSLRLILHVSLSESWAYGVSDAMLLGTVCLVSRAIDWVDPSLGLTVENPDNPIEIAEKMNYALGVPRLSKQVEEYTVKVVRENNHKLKKGIMNILEQEE